MKEITWLEGNQIQIDPPKKTKKITGTRFATILGLNPWSTPFEMWCAITKTYEKPFEDTIYTIAGKTIEPKQADYMKKSYGMDLITPTDRYGEDYFNKTWGDFFPENNHLGGMWDFLGVNENGKVDTVLEMKTTKRIEDWQEEIPEYYALQAALYAYLLEIDNVIMVASFLEEKDYDNPDGYIPNIKNTITREFKVSERYPDFAEKVDCVEKWWQKHIETGISPEYDENKDAEILKTLRTNTLSPDTDIQDLIVEGEQLKQKIDEVNKNIADYEKRLKKINELLKNYMQDSMKDNENRAEINGNKYSWILSKSESKKTSYDDEALKADGLWDKYTKTIITPNYRLLVKETK